MIMVVGFSTIFGGIMLNVTSNQQRSANVIVAQYEKKIVRNALESATNVAVCKLYQDFGWQTGYSNESFIGASYSVSVTNVTDDSTTEAKKVQITASATYENDTDTTIVRFLQPAYSYYYLYSKKWPGFMQFETGDTLLGPIHSNERIKISGSPIFVGKVSLKHDTYQGGENPSPKFYGGAEFGISEIPPPNINALKDSAQAGGDVYNQELWLTFNANGSYACSTSTVDTTKLISSFNGTIMTTNSKHIHVKGVVNGQVTVVSDNKLFIEDDIVYASDPRVNPNSDDYLGLVADDHFIIADNAANASDVEIHAALLTRKKTKVENYKNGPPRGTLTILGSIVRDDADPYGKYVAEVLVSGYELNHVYDERLKEKTPPYFPRLSRIEMVFRSN